jgi:VWFA-related protein
MRTTYPIILIFLFAVSAAAQAPSPTPQIEEDDRPVQITTSLIQLDAQVVGKDGKPATGLTANDFSIFQDGRQQQITSVTYVDEKNATRTVVDRRSIPKSERKIGAPPAGVRSRQGRIISFVLDDGNCLATIEGNAGMRDAMRRFIDEQMLPDDRVAVYRTATGASLLQPYTSNKEALRRLVNRITFLPQGNCGSSFEPLRDKSTMKITGEGARSFESDDDRAARTAREGDERRNQVNGTIGVVNFVIDRLQGVSQRKTVFLFSEGIIAKFEDHTFDMLRELADRAARSSVVIHTLSNKGAFNPLMITAQDDVTPGQPGTGSDLVAQAMEQRGDEARRMAEGLAYLAYETGGRFVRNSNRLERDVEQVLEAQSGYYLIAYEPDSETFRGKAFHRIEIKVNRPDLSVTSRSGFYGREDRDTKVVYKNADSPLFHAIASPFAETGMDVKLTLLYGNKGGGKGGDYLRALVHVPGRDLGLTDDVNGGKKTTLDVVGVILDEKGKVVDEFNRTYPMRIPAAGVDLVMQNGLDFSTDTVLPKAGVYSYRIAIRNNNTKLLGSAGEVVDVPDLKKKDLRVTSLVTSAITTDGSPLMPVERPIKASFAPVMTEAAPSVRRYARGTVLSYAFSVYNWRSTPNLTRELRLFKDGSEIARLPEEKIETHVQQQTQRIDDYGVLRITDAIVPGEYILQLIVRDKTANKASSQWIDFEVLN